MSEIPIVENQNQMYDNIPPRPTWTLYEQTCEKCGVIESYKSFEEECITVYYCWKCSNEGYELHYYNQKIQEHDISLCPGCKRNCEITFYDIHSKQIYGGNPYQCVTCDKYWHPTCAGIPMDFNLMDDNENVELVQEYSNFLTTSDFICPKCMPRRGWCLFFPPNVFTVNTDTYKDSTEANDCEKMNWIKILSKHLETFTIYDNNLGKYKLDVTYFLTRNSSSVEIMKGMINLRSFYEITQFLFDKGLYEIFFNLKRKRGREYNKSYKSIASNMKKKKAGTEKNLIFQTIFNRKLTISYRVLFGKGKRKFKSVLDKMKASDNETIKKLIGEDVFYLQTLESSRNFSKMFEESDSRGYTPLKVTIDNRFNLYQINYQQFHDQNNNVVFENVLKGGEVPIEFIYKLLKFISTATKYGGMQKEINHPLLTEILEKIKFVYKELWTMKYNSILPHETLMDLDNINQRIQNNT